MLKSDVYPRKCMRLPTKLAKFGRWQHYPEMPCYVSSPSQFSHGIFNIVRWRIMRKALPLTQVTFMSNQVTFFFSFYFYP